MTVNDLLRCCQHSQDVRIRAYLPWFGSIEMYSGPVGLISREMAAALDLEIAAIDVGEYRLEILVDELMAMSWFEDKRAERAGI